MTLAIVRFELMNSVRRVSNYLFLLLFFALGLMATAMAAGAIGGIRINLEGVKANSPFALYFNIGGVCILAPVVIASVTGRMACQDFLHRVHPLIFTTTVSKSQLLFGRFIAANVVQLVILSSFVVGCFTATLLPRVDPDLVVENSFLAYFVPWLLAMVPNIFIVGAIFFAVAALQRSMTMLYALAVLTFAIQGMAEQFVPNLDSRYIADLLDPLGTFAFQNNTRYLTVSEKNSQLVPLAPTLLLNRAVWIAVASMALASVLYWFRFSEGETTSSKERVEERLPARTTSPAVPIPHVSTVRPAWLVLVPGFIGIELRRSILTRSFLVALLGLGWLLFNAAPHLGSHFGTSMYPVTAVMIGLGRRALDVFVLATATIYAGQLVWRERDENSAQLYDTTPVPTWLPFLSKLIALMMMQACIYLFVLLCCVLIQARQGYFHFEFRVYFTDFIAIQLPRACLLCVLALTLHVIVNQKYLGHAAMLCFHLMMTYMGRFGLDHRLLHYASHPDYTYSDMNGFGHFLAPIFYFYLYWFAAAGMMGVAGCLLYVRGLDVEPRARIELCRGRFTAGTRVVSVVALLVLLSTGGFIFYNTSVLNDARPQARYEKQRVHYEKTYKSFEKIPQPRIIRANIHADIFPRERRLQLAGEYELANKSSAPISTVLIQMTPPIEVRQLALGPLTQASTVDAEVGVYRFELSAPLQPDETVTMSFKTSFSERGFRMDQGPTDVVYNGTFFHVGYFPQVGYVPRTELVDARRRREYGLPPRPIVADIENIEARKNCLITSSSDWLEFEATVSTELGQTAIAPGTLQREWQQGRRHYFHYKADSPVLYFFSILSARYQVMRDRWRDVDVAIYYHQGHEYNLAAMMKALRMSLEYCSSNFGAYQARQLRIVENPRYRPSAQSFPATIPFSENAGFITRVDPDSSRDLHYPFYITAHEVAHQWWAHQVVGGNVQGVSMLSESLAQYTALMIVKQEFGAQKIQRFLRYELDMYLTGRGNSTTEMPLVLDEMQQFVHYNKGALVFYALQEYLGEEAVNQVLREFVSDKRFQEPPYVTSRELVDRFREAAPPPLRYVVDDLFETVTLYDNSAQSATSVKSDDGSYQVRLLFNTEKRQFNKLGDSQAVPFNDLIDIGVQDAVGHYIYLEKHRVTADMTGVTITVAGEPARAGIDPNNILIDRNPDDNIVDVTAAQAPRQAF